MRLAMPPAAATIAPARAAGASGDIFAAHTGADTLRAEVQRLPGRRCCSLLFHADAQQVRDAEQIRVKSALHQTITQKDAPLIAHQATLRCLCPSPQNGVHDAMPVTSMLTKPAPVVVARGERTRALLAMSAATRARAPWFFFFFAMLAMLCLMRRHHAAIRDVLRSSPCLSPPPRHYSRHASLRRRHHCRHVAALPCVFFFLTSMPRVLPAMMARWF